MDEQLVQDAERARNGGNTHRLSALLAMLRNAVTYGPEIAEKVEEELREVIRTARRTR